jgi:hypothetical protein
MDISTLDDQTTTLSQTVGHQSASDTTPHFRRTDISPASRERLKTGNEK